MTYAAYLSESITRNQATTRFQLTNIWLAVVDRS
jgi:hypothetical protein